MKMRILILFIGILVIGWLGCDPDCESPVIPEEELCIAAKAPIYHPGAMTYGRVAGLKNCLPFVASATAYLDKISTTRNI